LQMLVRKVLQTWWLGQLNTQVLRLFIFKIRLRVPSSLGITVIYWQSISRGNIRVLIHLVWLLLNRSSLRISEIHV
jgi:hypothetical protein